MPSGDLRDPSRKEGFMLEDSDLQGPTFRVMARCSRSSTSEGAP
jgi:hypothetical protein